MWINKIASTLKSIPALVLWIYHNISIVYDCTFGLPHAVSLTSYLPTYRPTYPTLPYLPTYPPTYLPTFVDHHIPGICWKGQALLSWPSPSRAQEFQPLGSGTSVSGRAGVFFDPNGCDLLQPLVLWNGWRDWRVRVDCVIFVVNQSGIIYIYLYVYIIYLYIYYI